jgi:hypothetical protein
MALLRRRMANADGQLLVASLTRIHFPLKNNEAAIKKRTYSFV